jgi:hypothetical protein
MTTLAKRIALLLPVTTLLATFGIGCNTTPTQGISAQVKKAPRSSAVESITSLPNPTVFNPSKTNVAAPASTNETLTAEILRAARSTPSLFNEPKPNEMTSGGITYEGIAVEIAHVDNPLQLLNPFAPAQYGSSELNLVRDPITGRPSGLNFFSLRF